MFCSIISSTIQGISSELVTIELDISSGMPVFSIIGSVSAKVRESQDRVRTALRNLGIHLPPKRITVNLSPGNLKKDGTGFDLAIAAALLTALEKIPPAALENCIILGELHLNGDTEAVPGILPAVITARQKGICRCIVPKKNSAEAASVDGITVIGIETLSELIDYCSDTDSGKYSYQAQAPLPSSNPYPDFADIKGQAIVKRASIISAAGFHNILLCGPPGSGKSMTAKRLPGIMPELTSDEKLEVSKIYSVSGLLTFEEPLITQRPFRAPHHLLSAQALCGGGRDPSPGEITLAHRGVLFIDELAEMPGRTLEQLRAPLEDHSILISRVSGSFRFPSHFLFAAAMNPCPCGYYPDMNKCSCSQREIDSYLAKISQPILDRIDLRVDVPAASYNDLVSDKSDHMTSSKMKAIVSKAFLIQQERYKNDSICFNSELSPLDIKKYCPVTDEGSRLLKSSFSKLDLSARAYHRILKLSRTIADLDYSDIICEAHISEAFFFRNRSLLKK